MLVRQMTRRGLRLNTWQGALSDTAAECARLEARLRMWQNAAVLVAMALGVLACVLL